MHLSLRSVFWYLVAIVTSLLGRKKQNRVTCKSQLQSLSRGDLIKSLDAESRLLEDLFAKRFNYYSLFAAAFVLLVFEAPQTNLIIIRIVLASGSLIFLLMFLSILRTNIIINRILDELSRYEEYPLTIALNNSKPISFPPNRSNTYIVAVSFVMFIMVLLLTVISFVLPNILMA